MTAAQSTDAIPSSQSAEVSRAIASLLADKPALHGGGERRWDVSTGTLDLLGKLVDNAERTIEVGCGVSTIVFAAAGTSHVAISPAADEYERTQAYCAKIGVDTTAIDFITGYSGDVLPAVEGTFDFALIDGAHSFPFPVVDYFYVSRLLRPGGVLLMDDVPIPSVGSVYRFLVTEPSWELLTMVDDRAAAFRLKDKLPAGDPWGEQAQNSSYPDFSFLPASRRVRVDAVARLTRASLVQSARRRYPALNRVAPRVRNWLT